MPNTVRSSTSSIEYNQPFEVGEKFNAAVQSASKGAPGKLGVLGNLHGLGRDAVKKALTLETGNTLVFKNEAARIAARIMQPLPLIITSVGLNALLHPASSNNARLIGYMVTAAGVNLAGITPKVKNFLR